MLVKENKKNNDADRVCISIIGANRTGKTTKLIQIMIKWKQNNPRGKIFAFDPQSKLRKIGLVDVFIYSNDKKFYTKIYSRDINQETGEGIFVPTWNPNDGCLFIMDDYRLLNKNPIPDEWLETLMNFRCEWNMDIIYVTHSPKLVLDYLTIFTTHYYIYYTKATNGHFSDKIPDFDLCNKLNNVMKYYRREFGQGTYPRFPHGIVVCDKEKIFLQNITKEELKWIEHLIEKDRIKNLTPIQQIEERKIKDLQNRNKNKGEIIKELNYTDLSKSFKK